MCSEVVTCCSFGILDKKSLSGKQFQRTFQTLLELMPSERPHPFLRKPFFKECVIEHLPLHNDQETFDTVVRVFVDVDDVDDVLAVGRAPVQLDFSSGLGVVLQNFERILDATLLVSALNHLAVDTQPEDIVAHRIVFSQLGGLDLKVGSGLSYEGN